MFPTLGRKTWQIDPFAFLSETRTVSLLFYLLIRKSVLVPCSDSLIFPKSRKLQVDLVFYYSFLFCLVSEPKNLAGAGFLFSSSLFKVFS